MSLLKGDSKIHIGFHKHVGQDAISVKAGFTLPRQHVQHFTLIMHSEEAAENTARGSSSYVLAG